MVAQKLTKMVCTVSDLNYNEAFIKKLVDHGMDAVRLNTAHQSPEKTEKIIQAIRGVSEKVAIILDTKGAELRTLGVKRELLVKQNDNVKIGSENLCSAGECEFYVNYDLFVEHVPVGTAIYIDDGLVELNVIKKNNGLLICRVVRGGAIRNKRSVNVPSINMSLPGLTTRDIDYIHLAIKLDVDFIAHSFVRNRQDVLNLQEIIDREKSDIKIIAKIENREGLDNFDEILQQAYGILIARGDLGVEIAAEEVPLVQKSIIRKCGQANKPVLIATHLLESMIKNPRPTQAEVSDVANAVLDGTDVLVLTGETAEGNFPIDSAETITRICKRTETGNSPDYELNVKKQIVDKTHYLIQQAVKTATDLPVKAILYTSGNGAFAGFVSTLRATVPVFVPCYSKRSTRELSLHYGIYAQYIEKSERDQSVKNMLRVLLDVWNLSETDTIVVLSDTRKRENHVDSIEILSIKECLIKLF